MLVSYKYLSIYLSLGETFCKMTSFRFQKHGNLHFSFCWWVINCVIMLAENNLKTLLVLMFSGWRINIITQVALPTSKWVILAVKTWPHLSNLIFGIKRHQAASSFNHVQLNSLQHAKCVYMCVCMCASFWECAYLHVVYVQLSVSWMLKCQPSLFGLLLEKCLFAVAGQTDEYVLVDIWKISTLTVQLDIIIFSFHSKFFFCHKVA